MDREWNSGRVTRSPDVLLEFHKKALQAHIEIPRLVTYHQERIDHFSQYAAVTVLQPTVVDNVIYVDFRGGNEAA